MKKLPLTLIVALTSYLTYAQVNSADGSFNVSSSTLPLTLKTNTTTRMTIINSGTNAGNIGIGTSNPTSKLDIVGTTASVLKLSSDNSCVQQIYTSGDADYFMGGYIIYRSRGTLAAPLGMLTNDRVGSFGANHWINGAYRSAAAMEIFTGSTPSATSSPGYIIFKTVANNSTTLAERVRISESGYLGVNKTNPAYHVDVAGTVNATNYLVNGSPLSTSQWTTNGTTINYATGNVGIGQATPAYKLDVAGTINATGVLVNGLPISTSQWSTSGTSINFATGNVGIGQAAPAYKLDVAGTINASSILINGQPFAGGGSQWATIGNTINYSAGNVGIGTSAPDAKLAVKGQVHAQEVKVDLLGAIAPDYVFEKNYRLMSLEEIKNYIEANKHLPEVPSAIEMEKNGLLIGEMNLLLLKKVEELTLHLIQLKSENDKLKSENEIQNRAIELLKEKIK